MIDSLSCPTKVSWLEHPSRLLNQIRLVWAPTQAAKPKQVGLGINPEISE